MKQFIENDEVRDKLIGQESELGFLLYFFVENVVTIPPSALIETFILFPTDFLND